jgi:hypothetical protein
MEKQYIAMVFSILGMAVNIISFQVKNKRPLLLLQSLGNVLFLISFVFNGSGMAVILNVIYLVRNFAYILLESKMTDRLSRNLSIFISATIVASYAIYTSFAGLMLDENLWNLLPIAASLFGTVATSCNNVNHYRAWKFGDSYCWLFFNARFGIGALGGIVGEVFNQVSLIVGLIRYKKEK